MISDAAVSYFDMRTLSQMLGEVEIVGASWVMKANRLPSGETENGVYFTTCSNFFISFHFI